MLDLNFSFVDPVTPVNVPISAPAGRVTTMDTGQNNIASVTVTAQPAFGRATVNPDNTVALVLTGTTDTGPAAVECEVTYTNATTRTITFDVTVTALLHGYGWSVGRAYKLETDANGASVIPRHSSTRTVYITGSGAALTRADIGSGFTSDGAAAAWLKANPGATEGASPGQAIDEGVGLELWRDIMDPRYNGGVISSPHLYFERGHIYDTFTPFVLGPWGGVDALHPAVIGAWGSGLRPEFINFSPNTNNNESTNNLVIKDVRISGQLMAWRNPSNKNIMFENVYFSKHEHTWDATQVDLTNGITYRNCIWLDAFRSSPVNGTWEPNANRISCLFANALTGLLIENCFLDKCGWDDGYDPDADPDPLLPQPPSIYSHPIYLSYDTEDVTLRNVTSMRSAATGVQLRPGGHVMDCLFMDNNDTANVSGGGADDRANFTLFMGSVATSAGYRISQASRGNYAAGIVNQAILTTYTENIVAHAANPDDPTEIAAKSPIQYAIRHGSTNAPGASYFHEDTKVYRWGGANPGDQNLGGLNTATLDATTIQNYTATLTGGADTIVAYSDHMRSLYSENWNASETTASVLNYFKAAFGLPLTGQGRGAAAMRFVPNDLCEGVRWDVRLNWINGDIPRNGDSIALAGAWTRHGSLDTLDIVDLDLGDGGKHEIDCARLNITGTITAGMGGATLGVSRSAQVWFAGYDGVTPLAIAADGGLLANTGDVTGAVDLSVSGQAYVLLATKDGGDWAVGSGSLTLSGSACQVGFDGESAAAVSLTLGVSSTLSFIADTGLATIGTVASGAFAPSSVASTVTLGGILHLDVTGLANGTYTLIDVDTVSGTFASVTAAGNSGKDLTIAITGSTVTVAIADGSGVISGGT